MVISFSEPKPRAQLVNKGHVYTVRKKRRKRTGRTWWNKGRLLPKEGDVDVVEVAEVQRHDLRGYVGDSGFNTMKEWCKVIASLNKWPELKPDKKLWLYSVHALIECPSCHADGQPCYRCKGSGMIRGLYIVEDKVNG